MPPPPAPHVPPGTEPAVACAENAWHQREADEFAAIVGAAPASSEDAEEIRQAHRYLRRLLSTVHVIDALAERSRVLVVDAELPVVGVLAAVLSEQHFRPPCKPPGPQGGSAPAAADHGTRGRANSGGEEAPAEELPPLMCGLVAPSLPSNVLAEVCEFNMGGPTPKEEAASDAVAEDVDSMKGSTTRRWTSPDDGWGGNMTASESTVTTSMHDLEKMPMGMPVTVGEIASFLALACKGETAGSAAADKDEAGGDAGGDPPDMLDWSLAQWRKHRLKTCTKDAADEKSEESKTPIFVEERPRDADPVLVHRVALAPPRPILCTDDPEATLLKAVELLLCYPHLDALPIVSPVRCTVVAHLTLAYCLAYVLGRLRGNDLLPLANLKVCAGESATSGAQQQWEPRQKGEGDSSIPLAWGERPQVSGRLWVMNKSRPISDLLAFFESTPHSTVPIVQDEGGGFLGLVSRRDLLHFLDLAMQSTRHVDNGSAVEGTKPVQFNTSATIEELLETVRKFTPKPAVAGEAPVPGTPKSPATGALSPQPAEKTDNKALLGASLVYEKALTVKALLLRVLGAENRKVVFVEDLRPDDSVPPRLLRLISVSDTWRLLIGLREEGECSAEYQEARAARNAAGEGCADDVEVQDA
eukprot:gnl/TRDRNA2_/TRDRNA2_198652_c0_seq1.p1 gnl/TRDRNA2_/TRDRNA2_198652_c0~~gnl/TRDRNA2_/TRDRNA2_198652_c0_seq1.p1  ORF type:complete len:643 (+),score=137.59 gnl/TRDRNA2_/TRDRNA2_198652_c0_seq1:54-1982(+)